MAQLIKKEHYCFVKNFKFFKLLQQKD